MNYSAYNLTIHSVYPLPLPLASPAAQPDITISFGSSDVPDTLQRTYDGVWYAHGPDSLYLLWETIASFFIQGGNSITMSLRQGDSTSTSSPAVPLLGTVMAAAMNQMGMAALHGSSIRIDGSAVIFLAAKGQGKSTLAGYCKKQGHTLISDDVCAIGLEGPVSPVIYPSFPVIKLWPDTMESLEIDPRQYEKVHPGFEKRMVSVDSGFADGPSAVKAIIVLAHGEDITLQRLTGHQAIPALLPHLIINRFPENQPDALVKATYFQLTKLILKSSIFQLSCPRDISLLPTLYKLILQKTADINPLEHADY